MALRRLAGYVLGAVVALAVVSLIAGSVLGQPLLLSYVETGSMAPSLEAGDGFVAVPTQLDSSIEEGDIVVFEAEQLHGGGLTTHRVVGETEQGFITRGDANPFTDQSGEEPPVKRAQIVAQAVQVNGEVVAIPHFGTVVGGTQSTVAAVQQRLAVLLGMQSLLGAQGLAYLFFSVSVVWYIIDARRADGRKSRETSRDRGTDARLVAGAFAALIVLGATAAMAVPAGTHEYGIVSAEFDSDRPDVIPAGESKQRTSRVGNGGLVPMMVFLEPASEGVDVHPRELSISGGGVANATLTLQAPPETGYYRRFVAEHRYLAVLPPGVIRRLHVFHPWAPVAAIDALLGIPFYLFSTRLVGTARVRTTTRDGPSALRRTLNRLKP